MYLFTSERHLKSVMERVFRYRYISYISKQEQWKLGARRMKVQILSKNKQAPVETLIKNCQ